MKNKVCGTYLITMNLNDDQEIRIGKLGDIIFKKGYYVYVGSALNGLNARIQRHLRKQKKFHWHIDYLLDKAKVTNIFYKKGKDKEECNIAQSLEQKLATIMDFGSSDCSCKGHLFYGNYKDIMGAISNLQMTQYEIDAKS